MEIKANDSLSTGQWGQTGQKGQAGMSVPPVADMACRETALACDKEALRAIVLSGSLARDEGTLVRVNDTWSLLGDAEFFLVLKDGAPLPSKTAVLECCQRVQHRLWAQGVRAHIVLSPVYPRYLRALPRRILSYELKHCGRVIWGEPGILSLVPEFEASGIVLEDAWRLLANRMVEQVGAAGELPQGGAGFAPGALYPAVKLYLDMATSLLVFLGAYRPTYRARAVALRSLVEAEHNPSLPFDLAAFCERVAACTHFKLHGVIEDGALDGNGGRLALCEEAAGYARALWRWELEQLTHAGESLSDCQLFRVWMGMFPIAKRLRGWAYVLRASGWYRSWRWWPHWASLCRQFSPRHAIYSAASEIFFDLPSLMRSPMDDGNARWNELAMRLPVRFGLNPNNPGWRELAAEIAANYHQFVEGTCA